jgi:hypothetical protein
MQYTAFVKGDFLIDNFALFKHDIQLACLERYDIHEDEKKAFN